ncbi:MAG: DUF456 domain-containing protein [Bacteroidales bacterium]|nr:DUF456 domain-containing protein [Bacteroidales bacterium]
MNTALIVIAIVCVVVGLIGSVVPALPGPPVSWVGLLVFAFTTQSWSYIWWVVGITGAITLFLILLDYLMPGWAAKHFGGSKRGMHGANLGALVSLVVFPILGVVIGPANIIGIILGPFVGAYIGELTTGADGAVALKAAFGSFLGLLGSTLVKFFFALFLFIYVIVDIFV